MADTKRCREGYEQGKREADRGLVGDFFASVASVASGGMGDAADSDDDYQSGYHDGRVGNDFDPSDD